MDDFTFNGRHIREFGAVAAFGNSMRYGGKARRGAYALPGGGSVMLGDTVWQSVTRSVTIAPADGVDADEHWRREIVSWLQEPDQAEMVVDNDPGVILIAGFDSDGVYGTRSWPGGALERTMTIQPLAYAAMETQGMAHAQDGQETLVPLEMPAGLPVPLTVRIVCTSGVITAVRICVGAHEMVLPNLQLSAGSVLGYDGGTYLHDPIDMTVDGMTDFSPADGGKWASLEYRPGADVIRVTATGGEADVSVSARRRTIA